MKKFILIVFNLFCSIPLFSYGTAICLLLDWASSIFIQIPINLQLAHGKDLALIQYIMDTNWGRIVLETAQAVVVFFLMMGVSSK